MDHTNTLDTVRSFLELVHPTLITQPEGFRPCIELRPIPRGEDDHALRRSLSLWDLSSESLGRLKSFLELHKDRHTCLYYSVFCYDNRRTALTKQGTPAKNGKITADSALFTNEIALDFDGIGEDEYISVAQRMEDMGLRPLWVFTGHGYQAHILLSEPLHDRLALKNFVYLARSRGFDCDSACIDPARVMRLPGTRNCKCFSSDTYKDERDDPPLCRVTLYSDTRTAPEAVFAAFRALPEVERGIFTEEMPENTVSGREEDIIKRAEYPELSALEMPDAVRKMLGCTKKGHRNQVLGVLVRYFIKQHRMGRDTLRPLLERWAEEACLPPYDKGAFESDFSRFYYFGGLSYSPALSAVYGPIDWGGLIELRKKEIFIPGKLFKAFGSLSGQAIRLYLAIKMLEHTGEDATAESLCELLGLSLRALRTTLSELQEGGMIYVKKGVRRAGVPDSYLTDRFLPSNEGYMPISYNDVKAYISELYTPGSRGNGELKVYLYLRWKFYSGNIFVSQATLGEQLGLKQNSVSVIMSRLSERQFIKIDKVRRGVMESCVYTLLR